MTPGPEYGPPFEPVRASPLGLALVIALNGVLIIRPEEVYPPLDGLRLYYFLIVCSLLWYAPAIARELGGDRFPHHPLLVLVLGLLGAVVLSQAANLRFGEAFENGQKFAKLVAYYVFLTTALTSLPALRTFLSALVVFIIVQTTLALLQYHGYIDVMALRPFMQKEIDPDGEVTVFPRLCGSGIYNDPNDLCLLLTAGMLICLNRSFRGGFARLLWLAPVGYFGYALTLTQSRGGLLAAAAGFAGTLAARYGVRRAAPLLLLAAPAAMVLFAGRQTRLDLASQNDTGQMRIQLWSDGFVLISSHPLFGIGAGEYADAVGEVAHNSFIHAYVELGLLGGGLFLAAFLLAARAIWTTRPCSTLPSEDADELIQLRPVIFGLLASYMAGMYSLSRDYIPPTYLNLALATIYVRLAAPSGLDWFRIDQRMVVRLGTITVLGFIGLKLCIMALVRY
jgi:O-antigen ligase